MASVRYRPVSAVPPVSGEQFELRRKGASATVVSVGAGLRAFSVGGEAVVLGYRADQLCSAGRGQVLVPWPNRLDQGRYRFGGRDCVAPLDEPGRGNAIHGLVRWLEWHLLAQTDASVTLGVELSPQPGYPWRLGVEVAYELDSGSSLRVELRATNRSEEVAPFGAGFHPYLAAGPGGADRCRLRLPARRRLVLDGRGLPAGEEEVGGGRYDFTAGASLDGLSLDDCFTELGSQAESGGWRAELERGDGRRVAVEAGGEFSHAMVFTADPLEPPDRRAGVAVEPMTCGPNALATGAGLMLLEGGATVTTRFRIVAAPW